jgi:hypothetical protein
MDYFFLILTPLILNPDMPHDGLLRGGLIARLALSNKVATML